MILSSGKDREAIFLAFHHPAKDQVVGEIKVLLCHFIALILIVAFPLLFSEPGVPLSSGAASLIIYTRNEAIFNFFHKLFGAFAEKPSRVSETGTSSEQLFTNSGGEGA